MLPTIIIASFLVSLTSFSGAFLLVRKDLSKKIMTDLLGFAAGVILVVAFLDLLVEAVEHAEGNTSVFMMVLLGVVISFFIERFLLWYYHADSHNHIVKGSTVLILIGDSIHNFIDGVIIATTFMSNPALGIATTVAVAAHEIPHEIADFGILLHNKMDKTKALFFNFLSSLTALLGAFAGYYILTTVENVLPYFLGFSAGMFIYIACADLIPEIHSELDKERRWRQTLPFILGLVLTYLLLMTLHGEH